MVGSQKEARSGGDLLDSGNCHLPKVCCWNTFFSFREMRVEKSLNGRIEINCSCCCSQVGRLNKVSHEMRWSAAAKRARPSGLQLREDVFETIGSIYLVDVDKIHITTM